MSPQNHDVDLEAPDCWWRKCYRQAALRGVCLEASQPGDVPICSRTRLRRHEIGKGLPQQAEVAQGVPGRLRPRIFLTFGTTRVVGRQPYAPAAFTPGEIPGTHF
jgi:hypothetical protein